MKYYNSYIERQEVTPELHERLLNLEARKKSAYPWLRYGALAACAVLIVGVGVWKLAPAPDVSSAGQFAASYDPLPGEKDTVGPEDSLQPDTVVLGDWDSGFVVNSPVDGNIGFYDMPGIAFPDRTESSDMALSRVYAPGSFTVDLTMEDIQTLFWGAEGIPETYHTEIGRQDLPWALFWDGYFVHGTALYDGQGQLMELTLYGEKGRASFTLELRPGGLPFTCCIDLGREDTVSDVFGVSVTGWSRAFGRDRDGFTDYICGSEFMTENNIGVRFVNQNSAMQAEYVQDGDMDLGGAQTFNTLFVRQALTGGLYLDHLMVSENIPAWREEEFSTLAQARQEIDFAPYLPQTSPMPDAWEFYGCLSYQEGTRNTLFVRWSREYDNVEVSVRLPGDSRADRCEPADINVPESYDTRLYTIPWSESVPEEYRANFFSNVTFRAGDMSLEVVRARETAHDTGGSSYRFQVLHEDGTVVAYSCDGMTAEQVWALVEETL